MVYSHDRDKLSIFLVIESNKEIHRLTKKNNVNGNKLKFHRDFIKENYFLTTFYMCFFSLT